LERAVEYMQRVIERLKLVIPITLFIVFLLLYFNTGSLIKTTIILFAVHFLPSVRSGSSISSATT